MLQVLVLGAVLAATACEHPALQTAAAEHAVPVPSTPDATSEELVHVRLVADTTAFVPGEERMLGVSFEIAAGWHVYAQARNDSGSPVSVKLELPPGYGTQPIPGRPMAVRHVAPGGLLDHVYEHEVTLPVRLEVPQDSPPGSSASFRAHVEWFVCKDICVPGAADVSLTVPIVASPGQRQISPDESRLRAAEARLPQPLPGNGAPVALALHGDTIEVHAAGATGLTFIPYTNCVPLPRLLEEGEVAAEALTLHLDPRRAADAALVGALEVRRKNAPSEFYAVHLAAPPDPDSPSH